MKRRFYNKNHYMIFAMIVSNIFILKSLDIPTEFIYYENKIMILVNYQIIIVKPVDGASSKGICYENK